jgi:uncharacterized protein YndB with AHSA1/START domain
MTTKTKQHSVTLVRYFDAPRELVFKAWTDPKHMTAWWGPHGFTSRGCELDPKAGGIFKICMDAPKFPDHWTKGVFKEVVKPRKLVFTVGAFIGDDDTPKLETLNTITFEEEKGRTKLTVQAVVMKSDPSLQFALDGMEMGWSQSLEKLSTVITGLLQK